VHKERHGSVPARDPAALVSVGVGSRVNYVLIRDGRSERYAQGGGAGYGLDYHFAAGPEITLRWLAQLDDYQDDFWIDDLSCEGAVLIDVDARHLLLFTELGQVALEQRYAYRAGLLDGYRRTWGGWTVSWAYDGIGDPVAYLGENRDHVRSEHTWRDGLHPDGGQRPDGPVEYLGSVADADECRAYALPVESCPPWLLGPRLLDRLDPHDLVTTCSTAGADPSRAATPPRSTRSPTNRSTYEGRSGGTVARGDHDQPCEHQDATSQDQPPKIRTQLTTGDWQMATG